jgi:phage FluMu protein Com
VKFLRKETADGATYETYCADTAENARQFLLKKQVPGQLYYVVVETPEGNWGIDVKGLYLEHLLPWQSDFSRVDTVGQAALGLVSLDSARNAALGAADNFVHGVICGKCAYEWLDGLRLNTETVVRCPKCRAMNRVTSPSCHFVVGEGAQPSTGARAKADLEKHSADTIVHHKESVAAVYIFVEEGLTDQLVFEELKRVNPDCLTQRPLPDTRVYRLSTWPEGIETFAAAHLRRDQSVDLDRRKHKAQRSKAYGKHFHFVYLGS